LLMLLQRLPALLLLPLLVILEAPLAFTPF
jgi:hypothetical protein